MFKITNPEQTTRWTPAFYLSNDTNDYCEHKEGAIAAYKGDDGYRFYVIRHISDEVVYKGHPKRRMVHMQLLSSANNEMGNTSHRTRLTMKQLNSVKIVDLEKWAESHAQFLDALVHLGELRMEQAPKGKLKELKSK